MRKKTITKSSGFTLLELLISITLIAVLVLILSMAVRTGLRAYSRGKEINGRLIAVSAIEGLFGRQLRAVVREEGSDLKDFSEFHGEENEISFVTTHVPLGSQAGGLFKVVYRFDERGKKLIYAQKVITRPEDLKESLPDSIDPEDKEDLMEQGWGVSIVDEIDSLAFTYQSTLQDESAPEDWQDGWNKKGKVPEAVAMGLAFSDDAEEPATTWRIFYMDPLLIVD
ncbi:MAG: prepilin-type N-terminal cleavage/methylation domain-containing protein [Deltaproteobacteria bacterium]|nr:prepilin-type N-terminal cleavage/methylation domain-containing protein [Deltaproteobacteria bacterium]MDL1960391.1 prepilin-type N-terminal cleavage/methylation domain-containing protein [Deltaproteobacteria bacterium]